MRDKTLLMAEAMNDIDDRFIEEAHTEAKGLTREQVNRKRTFRQVLAVACLCLVAIGAARLPDMVSDKNTGAEAVPMAPGVGNSGNSFADPNDGAHENNSSLEEEAIPQEPEAGTEEET